MWLADENTLVARRDIAVGEEFTMVYALFEGDEDDVKPWACRCGSPLCRHRITIHMAAGSHTTPAKRRSRKRADGEGNLHWVESKKLWVGQLMVGYRDGKPDLRKVYARTQDGARRLRRHQAG